MSSMSQSTQPTAEPVNVQAKDIGKTRAEAPKPAAGKKPKRIYKKGSAEELASEYFTQSFSAQPPLSNEALPLNVGTWMPYS